MSTENEQPENPEQPEEQKQEPQEQAPAQEPEQPETKEDSAGGDDAQAKQGPRADKEADKEEKKIRDAHSKKGAAKGDKKGSRGKGGDSDDSADEGEDSGIIEKVIAINRITKVTKGGKKMSFSALVVVGDTNGNVGYSLSKAAEVATAIRKAMATAKKNMIKVPIHGTTIPHEIIGRCSGSRVLLKPASDGTGVIASGPVRAVCDGAGIHNILTKCHRSNNPINVVKATMDGLTRLKPMAEEQKETTDAAA